MPEVPERAQEHGFITIPDKHVDEEGLLNVNHSYRERRETSLDKPWNTLANPMQGNVGEWASIKEGARGKP